MARGLAIINDARDGAGMALGGWRAWSVGHSKASGGAKGMAEPSAWMSERPAAASMARAACPL